MNVYKRLENKYETYYKIYITCSIHLCLEFEAAIVYLGGWFILYIFVDFVTFHFNIKPKKNKIFSINSINFNLVWAIAMKYSKHCLLI